MPQRKKVTATVRKKKRGRPKGSRGTLPHGMVKTLKILSGLPQEALDHPEVQKAQKTIEGIMDGSITGRHIHTRLQAAQAHLEFWVGKVSNKTQVDAGPTLAELLASAGEDADSD